MRSSRFVFFNVVLIMSFGFAVAQNDPSLDTGLKPYGSYHGGDLDSVSLTNGNLTLHIPLAGYPQRGNLGYTPRIIYNSKGGWYVVPNCNSTTGVCAPYWNFGANPNNFTNQPMGMTLDLSPEDEVGIGWQPNGLSYRFTAFTSDGSMHSLVANQAGGMSTLDGTSIWYDGSNPNPTNGNTGISRDHNGNTNNPSFSSWEDPNGNFISFGSSSRVWTDTLGRTFPASGNMVEDSSGCTGPLPITNYGIMYLPAFNGTRAIKVCEVTVTLKSNFQATGYFNDNQTSITDRSYTEREIQSIVLYNGTSWTTSPAWTFEYSDRDLHDALTVNYGDLTKVTLPTGGSISYVWGMVSSCDPNAPDPGSRGVTSRTVDANDGTGPHTWTYNGGLVTDPAGNDALHTFTALGSTCSLYETQTQYYQGSYQSGHLLKTVKTDYQWIHDPLSTGTMQLATNVFPIRITTTWPDGKVTKTEKDYDTNLTYLDPAKGWTAASFGNVTEEREFDYGNGAPGPLLRRTDYAYKAFDGSSNAASYRAANLVSLVSSITTYDGNNNMVAQTKYGYDESTLQSSGLSSQQQHDTTVANPGTRGNRTSEAHWLNTTGGMVTSTVTYYDTGTPYQMIDPLGHVTTNTYGIGFQSGANFLGAYVTQTQNALQQNTFFDYDFGTGLRTGLKDANGQVTGWSYDFLNRTLQVNAPDNGNTTWTYNDTQPPTFTASTTIIGQTKRGVEGDMDGLGRAIHTKLTTDPEGVDTVDTTYDVLGRVATVSNPHRAGSSSTDGITTPTYDALGRVTQTTKQDGSISSVKYNVVTSIAMNADCTIATDEAGNQRGACTDALGRLVEVDEPNPGTIPTVSNYATMQTDGNFVLYSPSNVALWSSGTSGTSASTIFMQDDGNLVLYIFKWSAGTYATPSPGPFAPQSCSIGTYLIPGGRINANQCIVSPHGQYMLYMDPNGNFYIYDIAHGTGTWGANTAGHPGAYATLQTDGNFVVYDVNNVALWNSGTAGTGAERLDMEDDGRIIIYKSAWNSGTSTGSFNWTQLAHPACDVGTGTGTTGMLGAGQCFVSPNGHFALFLQTDGNLVLYDESTTPITALWMTNTQISPADPGVALRTLYTYDALGNLTCVEQHGGVTGTGCSSSPTNDATSPWRIRRFTYDSLGRLLTAKNPESGTISYTYDNDGNLLQKTSPAPNQTNPAVTQTISYCYDALHRVTGKAYSAQTCQNGQLPVGTAVVSYTYDQGTNGVGRLTSLADQAGTGTYTYDPMGRIASEQRTIAGISKSMSYSYYLDGSLKTATYPSGAIITYVPSGARRMLSAVDTSNNINYATGATYTPDGSLDGFISGKSGTSAGITNLFSYNQRLQPCRMTASTGALPANCTDTVNHGNVLDLAYDFHAGHGNNGNVYGLTNYKDTSRNQTFTYDSLDRLTSAQNAGTNCAATTVNGKTEYWGNNYSYDAWSNLLGKSVTKCSAENAVFTMMGSNQALYYSYDAAGNMLNDGLFSYTFDPENRITGAAGYTYTYDADGNRVKKSNGTTGTLYWYMTPGIVAESDLSGTLKSEYVFFDGERVARKDFPGNTVAYYFSDHLKTASIITDSSGNIKADSDYYPWGGELQFVNNDSNHFKFTGKEHDGETGLDYFGARYYSNGLGRWVSADWSATPVPVPFATLADPQTLNLYSYARSLPTTLIDDDGHGLGTPDMREVKAKQAEFAKLPEKEQWKQLGIGACVIICSGTAVMGSAELAGSALIRGLIGFGLATAPVTVPIAANVIEGATPGAPSLMGTLGISKITETIEDFSVGRLANGAEVGARIETSGSNTTVGILGAYNEGGPQFAGTLSSIENGARAVGEQTGSSTVTIQAIATNPKLTKFLLKQGFTKTTVKVGKEEAVPALQKVIHLKEDAK